MVPIAAPCMVDELELADELVAPLLTLAVEVPWLELAGGGTGLSPQATTAEAAKAMAALAALDVRLRQKGQVGSLERMCRLHEGHSDNRTIEPLQVVLSGSHK